MSEFKSQFAQGYEAGTIDEYHNNADELARLKAENNRLTQELEQSNKSYNEVLRRFRHLIQSDYIRSFDEWDREKGDYVRDISEADQSRLKAENNRLTSELERVYELYYTLLAERTRDKEKACPFGKNKVTCSDYRINRCDLCKFEDKGAEK